MRKFSAIAFAVLIGFAATHGQAWAQDGDDDDDAPAAAEPAAAEKPTRASKDLPELILGTKENQFTVEPEGFRADRRTGLPLEDHRRGRPRIQVPYRSLPQRLEESDRHQ